ncbi:hypothetical protein MMC07_004766 [Pseudocyphellaria aurata]|nr:hypothetical protein [Pseudocyphellaria aurata]
MKNFAAISAAFFALLASSNALPTAEAAAEALPAGFEPITRDEILRRLDTSSAASPLEKRTPGGVNYLFTDLPVHWKQLYRNLRLQGPAFQYLHSPHGSLVLSVLIKELSAVLQRRPTRALLMVTSSSNILVRAIFGTITESTMAILSHRSSANNAPLANEI